MNKILEYALSSLFSCIVSEGYGCEEIYGPVPKPHFTQGKVVLWGLAKVQSMRYTEPGWFLGWIIIMVEVNR
jgi:hypothetical protein